MKFDTFEVDGKKFTIDVMNEGEFHTTINGEGVKADTYEKLKQKIVRSQRREKVRVSLPATLLESPRHSFHDEDKGSKLVDVTITGVHRRNRTVLYRRDDTKQAGDTSYSDKLLKRLNPEQKTRLLDLLKAKVDSAAAYEGYINKFAYTDKVIRAEVDAVEKAAGLEPEEDE